MNPEGRKSVSEGPGQEQIRIDAGNSSFRPTYIDVKAGTTLRVRLGNPGQLRHSFTIDALKVDQILEPQTRVVELSIKIPDEDVVFYCKFHRAQGMQGAFNVGA